MTIGEVYIHKLTGEKLRVVRTITGNTEYCTLEFEDKPATEPHVREPGLFKPRCVCHINNLRPVLEIEQLNLF